MTSSRHTPRWKLWVGAGTLLAALTFLLLEGGLRLIALLNRGSLGTLVSEAQRNTYANVRVHAGFQGGVRILLPPPAPADGIVVGASMSFGSNVKEEDIFVSELARRSGKRFLNLSVGSQMPTTFNRMIEAGSRYKPKEVLYVFSLNDFKSTAEVRPLSEANARAALPGDENLFLERQDFSDRFAMAVKFVTNFSVAYQLRKLLQQTVKNYSTVSWSKGPFRFVFMEREYADRRLNWQRDYVREAERSDVALVEEGRRFASGWGGKVRALLLPSKESIYAPLTGELAQKIYDPSYDETYGRFREDLQKTGIEVLDATSALRAAAAHGKILNFTMDGHYNEDGHREIASLLIGFLGLSPAL